MKTPTDFFHKVSPESKRRSDMYPSTSPHSRGQQYQQQQQQQQQQHNHKPQHQGPSSKHTEGVDELIHFVRTYQGLQRETTDLRLKRHAPLPGIGQVNCAPGGDSLGSLQEEEFPRRGSYGRGGFNSDSEGEAELMPTPNRRRTPSPPSLLWKSDPNPLSSTSVAPQSNYISNLNRGTGNQKGLLRVNSVPGSNKVKAGRRITADVHQLPPINRHDIPDRPEAPTPDVPRDLERPSSRADRPSSARPWSRTSRRLSQEEEFRDKSKVDEDEEDEWAGLIDYIE